MSDNIAIFNEDLWEPVQKDISFEPSKYQQAIYDFVSSDDGHGIVQGVAGCGKTTSNIEANKRVPNGYSSVFLAFNKHISTELTDRGVQNASTFHSLGKANITSVLDRARFNQYKVYDIIDNLKLAQDYQDKSTIAKLVGLLKANLADTLDDALYMIDNFSSLNVDWHRREDIASKAVKVHKASVKDLSQYDFDDMIFFPASGIVPCKQFDFIFVDEAQDLNKAQIAMAEKTCRERMLIIGDPHQSIYAFRGAFVGIMEFMEHKLSATNLPLTISYRAPLAVVELVNRRFPHIIFEPSPMAQEGMIVSTDMQGFLESVQPGDGIICRTNAPLVGPCFALIRQGIKATILGRDIGKGLVSLINRRAKLKRCDTLNDLIRELYTYLNNERVKLEEARKYAKIVQLEDQIETIVAISDDCQTIGQLKNKISDTFSDSKEGIVFSSIHKAKGLEWDRVFILKPSLMPHPMSDDIQQETNIEYVAVTRAKRDLIFVE